MEANSLDIGDEVCLVYASLVVVSCVVMVSNK